MDLSTLTVRVRPSVFRAIREICGQRAIFARTDGRLMTIARQTKGKRRASERGQQSADKTTGLEKCLLDPKFLDVTLV